MATLIAKNKELCQFIAPSLTQQQVRPVQSEISDFGFELQDSSNFKFPKDASAYQHKLESHRGNRSSPIVSFPPTRCPLLSRKIRNSGQSSPHPSHSSR